MPKTKKRFPCALAGFIILQLTAAIACGQDDAVYRFREGGSGTSKINGKITGTTPFGVKIRSDAGEQEIPANEIDRITYLNEPLEVGRAQERFESGRFDDTLAELEKVPADSKTTQLQPEIDYLNSAATAEIALRGGGTPQDAGRAIAGFISSHPNSHHFYPATELLGKLFFAIGRLDLAEKEFAKLTQSRWPELVLRGHFHQGQALMEQEKYGEAEEAFKVVQSVESNDDVTQLYKQLAKVQMAKAKALAGNTGEAISTIEEIIKVENPDNEKLFAYAYNALGVAQLKGGNLKEAATAFLHTDLLFAHESDPHAEALYYLATIWPQLEQTDRASQSRESLKSRYRNSYWATKL